jgi:NTE family protein
MHEAKPRPARRAGRRLPYECVALLLQGGGALGAYQAGVYEALAEAGLAPDWVAGISIGAINGALIAGNPPEARVDRLRRFWETVTTDFRLGGPGSPFAQALEGALARSAFIGFSSLSTLLQGQPGFFRPRIPPPWLQPKGSVAATSYYDTTALRSTFESLIDFDRINAGETRFSVGAVNVRSGNFVYFDNTAHRIGPEHVMASGSLPPGFGATEIDGELYWDGGLVSNTPLQWVLDSVPWRDTLAFQVDLWSAKGPFPRDLVDVAQRQKEIQYSSRTRLNTDYVRSMQKIRHAVAALLEKLPPKLRDDPAAKALRPLAESKRFNIVHLIYRSKHYENLSKDYEFSRWSMREHWRAGYDDAVRTLRDPEALEPPDPRVGIRTFDLARGGSE